MSRFTNEIIMERIDAKWGKGRWTLISTDKPYKNVHMKHTFRCNKCGEIYEKRVNDLLHGHGCSICANLKRYTVEEMRSIVSNTDKDYIMTSETSKRREKCTFKHIECSNEFEMILGNFLNGERCPFCNKSKNKKRSKGEMKIAKFLDSNNIKYTVGKIIFDENERSPITDFYKNQ
jgi:predicted  nucleic acid-binding Zn-ribbon protein